MRIVFAGTPEFARVALAHLHAAGFEVPLVLTQPDRPAGRGMHLQVSPVKQFALAHGMALAQPRSLRLDGGYGQEAAAAREALLAVRADAMVVAAYGLILPQWVLDAMGGAAGAGRQWGCLNIHASLLPRWRGAAPIHRAVQAGDAQTGVTIMQMDAGLDTGAMLLAESVPIEPSDTTGSLHDRLAVLGARLVVRALALAAGGALPAVPQPASGVTYARKVDKAEAGIAWHQSAQAIARQVRAFDPTPGAWTAFEGQVVKVWQAHVDEEGAGVGDAQAAPASAGQVLAVGEWGVRVQTGCGVLVLTQLQRAGGRRLPVADFLRGFALRPGGVLESSSAQKAGH